MKNISSLLILLLFACYVQATVYYVKVAGGTGAGTSDATAWSYAKYNATGAVSGDSVLFNRGDVFYGTVRTDQGVGYAPYGTGANPILDGLTTLTSWTQSAGSVYYASLDVPSLNLVTLDGVVQGMGRFPKTGYLTYTSHSGNASITGTAVGSLGSIAGAQVVIRKVRWILDKHTITFVSGNTINYSSSAGEKNNNYSPVDGNGFFIQNHLSTLTQAGDWYYDVSAKRLYMHFGGDAPGAHTVKASTVDKIISISDKSNISFRNIDIRGANTDGVNLNNCGNISFVRCNVTQHGGNGLYANTLNTMLMTGGSVSEINNNGIFYEQAANSCTIDSVTFNKIAMIAGASRSGDAAGEAVFIIGDGATIKRNIVTQCGYVGINWKGNNALIENNLVDGFCYVKDDGGGIYTFGNEPRTNQVVNKNIVRNGQSALVGAGGDTYAQYGKAAGIYIDDFANHISITNNVAEGCSWGGLFLHNANNITATGNLCYNNAYQFHLDQSSSGNLRNLSWSNNQFIAKTATQKAMYAWSFQADNISSYGTADNNIYARPVDDGSTIQVEFAGSSNNNYTLVQWKSVSSLDANSSKSAVLASDEAKLRFENNYSASAANKSIPGIFKDLQNTSFDNQVSIPAYGAKVLIFQGASTFVTKALTSGGKALTKNGKILTIQVPGSDMTFGYTLTQPATVSAGAYAADSTLLKTLFSIEKQGAGSYSPAWNGTDEDGNLVPGQHQIRVLSNNVQSDWQRPIGNTSDSSSGSTVMHPQQVITNMAQIGGTMYYAVGYNEGGDSHCKFQVDNPHVVTTTIKGQGPVVKFLAYDGNKLYFVGQTVNFGDSNHYFVSALNPVPTGLDAPASFSAGKNITQFAGLTYSAGDLLYFENSLTSPQKMEGLAVQPLSTGNYLFVSHDYEGFVRVLNKNTMAVVRTINITHPRQMRCDNAGNLWMISGTNTVAKYSVNSDGSLSAATITLSGLTTPLGLTVSPDGTKVAVVDRGSAYGQVKFYNASSGAFIDALGRAESYSNPNVYDDKFYFSSTRSGFSDYDWGGSGTFIEFQSDGSFWVGDYGNRRAQHFAANKTYINNIQHMGFAYCVVADVNNPSRVFCDYLEFSVQQATNTWAFVKNWSYYPAFDPNEPSGDRLRSLTTLPNGKTYALYLNSSQSKWEIIRLDNTAGIIFTGILIDGPSINTDMWSDGSWWRSSANIIGQPAKWERKQIVGYDGSNEPVMGSWQTIETTRPLLESDATSGPGSLQRDWYNQRGIFFSHDPEGYDPANERHRTWHLMGVKNGKILWQAAHATGVFYRGAYPRKGYEIGNFANNIGTFGQSMDRLFLFGLHCEFFKGAQVNKYHVFHDTGLQLTEFGVDNRGRTEEAYPGFAGNALKGTIVKVGNDIYLHHADEGAHAGIHQWRISNLASITEHTPIPVTIPTPANGLIAYQYSTADVDNCNLVSTSSQTSFTITGASAKWKGFVKPLYSESYTFYVQTTGSCRLRIGDKIIIDAWGNSSNTELTSSTIALKTNLFHSLSIEGTANVSVSWSSASQEKQIIPVNRLFVQPVIDNLNEINLHEGLSVATSVKNGMYGFTRTPAADVTATGAGGFTALTSVQDYDRFVPDVQVALEGGTTYQNASLNRNLGNNSGLTSWAVKGEVIFPFPGSLFSANYRSRLEVLDAAGKVIVVFERKYIDANNCNIYANDVLLKQGTDYDAGYTHPEPQAYSFSIAGGKITARYMSATLSNLNVYESGADISSPRTLRIRQQSANQGGYYMAISHTKFIRSSAE